MRKSPFTILFVLLALVACVLAACGSSGSTETSNPPSGSIAVPAATSASAITNLVLSTDKAGAKAATTFAPTDTIYLSSDVSQLASGTSIDIKWYALNVSGQDPNTPFYTSNVVYSSGSSLSAQVNSTTGGFPVGQYRVEVDTNGTKAAEKDYTIQ
jgi:hypothetical protein